MNQLPNEAIFPPNQNKMKPLNPIRNEAVLPSHHPWSHPKITLALDSK